MWGTMPTQPPMEDCPACKGKGEILLFNHFSPCDDCGGIGKIKKQEEKKEEKKDDEDDDGSFICIAGL